MPGFPAKRPCVLGVWHQRIVPLMLAERFQGLLHCSSETQTAILCKRSAYAAVATQEPVWCNGKTTVSNAPGTDATPLPDHEAHQMAPSKVLSIGQASS